MELGVLRFVVRSKNISHLFICAATSMNPGTTRIGRTLVVNPGSEYPEGILRGAIVNIGDKKVVSWQLTSG